MPRASTFQDRKLRPTWLRASLVSGFVATFAMTVSMTVAYALANTIGESDGTRLQRWYAALSSNGIT